MEAIKVKDITKRYGQVVAVDNISFSVEQESIFGFLGPNGAGKSTTQRIATGVVYPDHGEVQIMGHNLQQQTLQAKELMGVVPEMANVYLDLSAWDNLMFVGDVYGVSKNKRIKRAEELLSLFGLYEKRKLKSKGFSKGMKQRLLLCMALMHDPQVLFLDEPTGGLDVESTRIIRKLIREFNFNGKTVFLTTHNIEEANLLCDYVAIINQGKIAAIDRPENLKKTLEKLQSVEVSFFPQIDNGRVLEEIEGVSKVEKTGDKYLLYTSNSGQAIFSVVDLARKRNLEILSLQTLGPSLEDVFLYLTEQNV